MLKNQTSKGREGQRGKVMVMMMMMTTLLPVEILIEPMGLLNLEKQSIQTDEFLLGTIENESTHQVTNDVIECHIMWWLLLLCLSLGFLVLVIVAVFLRLLVFVVMTKIWSLLLICVIAIIIVAIACCYVVVRSCIVVA